MDQTENHNHKKSVWAAVLLFLSCIAAIVLLWTVEPVERNPLTSVAQLDSLIHVAFSEFGVPQTQIQMRSVEMDSVFTRNIYSVRVSPDFSKTTFHYELHRSLLPYRAQTVGNVDFPDRDLHIHVVVNNTIHRSIYMRADPALLTF